VKPRPWRRAAAAALGAAALLLGAPGAAAGLPVPAASAAKVQAVVREAPAVAAQVAAGRLPPLAERLGAEPLVVTPVERPGRHGGVLRTALRGGGDHNAILRIVGPQGLVRWNADMTGVLPGVARAWSVSADATTFTFELRRGMRWSDGKPFGADDVVFAMNELVLDRAFNPSVPARYMAGGQPVRVEKLSPHSVRFRFAAPYRRFLDELATPLGQHATLYQRTYCARFHPRFAPAAELQALLLEGRHKDWPALMRQRCGDIELPSRWANPERPTLDPWLLREPYRGGATRVTLVRNPWFWQVDPEGRQLPYIDELQFSIISDVETILLKTLAGEIDLQLRHINLVQNKPVLAKGRRKAGLEFVDLAGTSASSVGLYFNLSHKDATLRRLFNERRFREAISHAIDREEILEAVYLGVGEPHQVGPAPQHPLFNRQLATQHLAFDPKRANALLDELGFGRRDGQRRRLWPDGRRLFFTIDYPVNNTEAGDILNLVRRDLAAVGIEVGINAVERSLFYDRAAKNDHDVGATIVPGGLDPAEDLRAIVAAHPLDSRQSLEWQKWYESRGARGETPSAGMQRRYELLDRWRAAPTAEAADALFRQMLQEAAEAFEVVGIVRPTTEPGMRRATLRNVPSPLINAWTFATPGAALPQQFFYDCSPAGAKPVPGVAPC
jgi:peptide/nickel transport system substrate-binding protein